jgi:hypothetical protein
MEDAVDSLPFRMQVCANRPHHAATVPGALSGSRHCKAGTENPWAARARRDQPIEHQPGRVQAQAQATTCRQVQLIGYSRTMITCLHLPC